MSSSPHDALFRFTFGQPEHAVPLLRTALPVAETAELDWTTLKLLPGTRLDRRLRRHQTDLLFVVRSRRTGREVLLYVLVEHSSRVVPLMALRLLDYAVGIWRDLTRANPRLRRLPRIVPLVVHHGRDRWWAATEFADLLDDPPAGAEDLRFPRFPYGVLSMAAMSPGELDGLALTLLGRVTLAMLQEVPRASPDEFARALARWGRAIQRLLRGPSGEEAMVALSEYVLLVTQIPREALLRMVENEVNRRASEIMESTGMKLRREGRAEGRAEGSAWLLASQLRARFGALPEGMEERLAQASAEAVERWALRLLDAQSLEQVFADEPAG